MMRLRKDTDKKDARRMGKKQETGEKEFGNLLDKERKQGSKHIVSRFYYEIPSVLYRGYLSPIPRYLTFYISDINALPDNRVKRRKHLSLSCLQKGRKW